MVDFERASVAVIGCGYWAQNLVRNFAQLGALWMVCDAADVGRMMNPCLGQKGEPNDANS